MERSPTQQSSDLLLQPVSLPDDDTRQCNSTNYHQLGRTGRFCCLIRRLGRLAAQLVGEGERLDGISSDAFNRVEMGGLVETVRARSTVQRLGR